MRVNEHFNDCPIDYFKISHENLIETAYGGRDGEESEYLNDQESERITKVMIEPNEEGKVYDSLKEHIDLDEKNTTVINIGVGQGKTYTILKVVQEYLSEHPDTYIILAVPYVSLVNQYVEELKENGIPEEDIYRYEWLDPSRGYLSRLPEQLKRRVHVVTANCLLGNAGDNAVINSKIKRDYLKGFPEALVTKIWKYDGRVYTENELDTLIQEFTNFQESSLQDDLDIDQEKANAIFDASKLECELSDKKKVVFIFDEIHDAIHNFTAENLMNLAFWSEVIHKNILLSATFNDPSLVVINKLAEFTDRKIQILESERKPIPDQQSSLYIEYDSAYTFTEGNNTIKEIVEKAITDEKEIDILVFSKKLAKSLFEGEVGNVLKEYRPDGVKLCASELISNQRSTRDLPENRYDGSKINIGTNFKTGINITKSNHCFIIILPAYGNKMPFENLFGVFSNGYIDLVQALARQRTKGEIHVVTMYPEEMDFSSLPDTWTEEQKSRFEETYKEYCTPISTIEDTDQEDISQISADLVIKHSTLNNQTFLIKEKFQEYVNYMLMPLLRTNRDFRAFRDFYRIDKGDLILQKNRYFGGDVAANLTINAFTNQFINCRLQGIKGGTLYFTIEGFEREMDNLFEGLIEDQIHIDVCYTTIVNSLFRNNVFFRDSEGRLNRITASHTRFKKQLMMYLLRKLCPDCSYSVFGHTLKAQHLILYIIKNMDCSVPETAEYMMAQVLENAKNKLIPNQGSFYYPVGDQEIFNSISISDFYDLLLVRFPFFKDLGFFKDGTNRSEGQKKTDLFNLLYKSLGRFGRSRRDLSFSDESHKKLTDQVL